MLPDHDPQEPAMLDRSFFVNVHTASIAEFQRDAAGVPGCDIPVGLTLTRLSPVDVRLTSNSDAHAAVQRFASAFSMSVTPEGRLDFGMPDSKILSRASSLGALAVSPLLSSSVPQERRDAVFDLVVASSSFPGAFAPRPISYIHYGLGQSLDTLKAQDGWFTDGGVFDNQPIGLGLGLDEVRTNDADTDPFAGTPRLIALSSASNYRGALKAFSDANEPEVARTGLGAVAQLLSGAFPSARQYELQAFARQLARDSVQNKKTPADIQMSTRSLPIASEALSSFGGFLGRPLRVHDFYLGIYDGLEFVARAVLCRANQTAECVARQHERLIRNNFLQLDPVALAMLDLFRCHEHHLVCREPDFKTANGAGVDLPAQQRFILIKAVAEGLPRREMTGRGTCKESASDPIGKALCAAGLDSLLHALNANDSVRSIVNDFAQECETSLAKASGRLRAELESECFVDRRFKELVDHPHYSVYLLAKRALQNLEHAEEKQPAKESGSYEAVVKGAFMLYRAETFSYRQGYKGFPFEWFLSTARSGEFTRVPVRQVLFGYLTPSYIEWTWSNKGKDNAHAGWRPLTFVASEKWFASSLLELSLNDLTARKLGDCFQFPQVLRRCDQGGFGFSLGTFRPVGPLTKLKATMIEVGPYWPSFNQRQGWEVLPTADQSSRSLFYRLSARFLADKAQATLVWRKDFIKLGIGLSDLNGSLFWIFR